MSNRASLEKPSKATWVEDVARWLAETPPESLPPEMLRVACRQTLDSVACALGALDHEAAEVMLRLARVQGGPPESSLIQQPAPVSAINAILYNGTLIRALDGNDIFMRGGPGGHPSDNIAVALAFAERQNSTGLQYLRSVVLGYELYWRLQQHVIGVGGRGYAWDHSSASGMVAAAMAGMLMGLDRARLSNALAIGGSHTYTLGQVRSGEISMLKGAANSVAAHTGALAALLAAEGMSGPPEVFEGERAMLVGLGVERSNEVRQALCSPPEYWHILDISIKPYPAIGTSQSALAATLKLVRDHRLQAADVESVEVRFADLPVTLAHLADPARRDPQTRETADHSIPFLVAAAIEDGDLGPGQYADERWLRQSTRQLMKRVTVVADGRLNSHALTEYPAVVSIVTRGGGKLRQEMLNVPGGPSNPLPDEGLREKLARFAGPRISHDLLRTTADRLMALEAEPNMAEVGKLLRGSKLSS